MRRGFIEDTCVDCVGDGVVDEFAENETVSAFIKDLHCLCGDGETRANIGVTVEHLKDVCLYESRGAKDVRKVELVKHTLLM